MECNFNETLLFSAEQCTLQVIRKAQHHKLTPNLHSQFPPFQMFFDFNLWPPMIIFSFQSFRCQNSSDNSLVQLFMMKSSIFCKIHFLSFRLIQIDFSPTEKIISKICRTRWRRPIIVREAIKHIWFALNWGKRQMESSRPVIHLLSVRSGTPLNVGNEESASFHRNETMKKCVDRNGKRSDCYKLTK